MVLRATSTNTAKVKWSRQFKKKKSQRMSGIFTKLKSHTSIWPNHASQLRIYAWVTNHVARQMDNSKPQTRTKLERALRLRRTAASAAEAAMTSAPGYQSIVLDAVDELIKVAESDERKAKHAAEHPLAFLPANATVDEVRKARRRQSVRKGKETFLPAWKDMALALPTAFLRSALFEASQKVQTNSSQILAGNTSLLVAEKPIGSLSNLTLTLSGYELCQFDRSVYAICLDYFRDRPLMPEDSLKHIETSFYEFITRMGKQYGVTTHKAVRASLLRLSLAQIRLRFNRWNLEVPKLLTASFEDASTTGKYMASDRMFLRVTECVADLFGPGGWTAVDKNAVGYDGLKGWLANFYAGHSAAAWLPVKTLYEISGYSSNLGNFKASLVNALEKLKDKTTPLDCRVSEYHFSSDGLKVRVILAAWTDKN